MPPSAKPPRRPGRRSLITAGVLAAGVVLIVLLVVLRPSPEPEPVSDPEPAPAQVRSVDPSSHRVWVQTQGTVAPRREIDLVAEVGGKVISVAEDFADGSYFSAGETLVTINPRDYELALVRAEAGVAEAQRELALEKGRARQAKREWRELGSPEANELFLREPQLAAAAARVDAAKAERDDAQLDLERTAVSAPFDGRIRETLVDLGQYVSPGTAVARVYSTDAVELRLPLTDRQVGLLDLPSGARDAARRDGPRVLLDGVIGGERYQWKGRVVRTEASIDVDSRVTYAVAEVTDPFSASEERPPLVVGLFVEVAIAGREFADAVELPSVALYKGSKVFTVDDDNRLRVADVQVLTVTDGTALVRGLTPGTRVVTSQIPYAVPGMAVAPLPADPEAESEPPADMEG